MEKIRRKEPYMQIAIGAAAGFITGYVGMKTVKSFAIGVGSIIILLEIGYIEGVIKQEWPSVIEIIGARKNDVSSPPALPNHVMDYAKKNKHLASAFVGGTLLGLGLS